MPSGGCHCGALRYEVSGGAAHAALCHCADCRRHAGAPAVAWALFPADRVTLTAGEPVIYASSEHGRRHFCGRCGTAIFYANDHAFSGMIDVQAATLDHPDAYPMTARIQVAERIGWMADAHELPEFERYPGM